MCFKRYSTFLQIILYRYYYVSVLLNKLFSFISEKYNKAISKTSSVYLEINFKQYFNPRKSCICFFVQKRQKVSEPQVGQEHYVNNESSWLTSVLSRSLSYRVFFENTYNTMEFKNKPWQDASGLEYLTPFLPLGVFRGDLRIMDSYLACLWVKSTTWIVIRSSNFQ